MQRSMTVLSVMLLSAAAAFAAEPAATLDEAREALVARTAESQVEIAALAELQTQMSKLKARLHATRIKINDARQAEDSELEKSARKIEKGYVTELEELRPKIARQRTHAEAADAAEAAARRLMLLREAEAAGTSGEELVKLRKRYEQAVRKATETAARLEPIPLG